MKSIRAQRGGRRGRGDLGEDIACQFLSSRGYEILFRGWTCRFGEIDIVARAGDGIVAFVEVKTAFSDEAGDPGNWITPTKRLRLCRTATAWLVEHDAMDREARFDLLLVRGGVPEHLEDAFPYLEG